MRGRFRIGIFREPTRTPGLTALSWALGLFSRGDPADETYSGPAASPINILFGIAGGAILGMTLFNAAPWLLAWTHEPASIGAAIFTVPLYGLWWLARAFLVFIFPMYFATQVFEILPAVRWVAVPLMILVIAWYFYFPDYLERKHARIAAENIAAQQAQLEADAERMARRRDALLQRRSELTSRLVEAWRSDVRAAGAIGKPGEVPPMLQVTGMRQQVRVVNRLDQPLSLVLARVVRAPEAGYVRCDFDGGNRVALGPHGSHLFQMFFSGNSAACMSGALEFRVGAVNGMEPVFWTSSAFEDAGTNAPPPDPVQDKSLETLQAEIAVLERRLADSDRVAHMRAALGKTP